MEQKHEEIEEKAGQKPKLWLPWLKLEDGNSLASRTAAVEVPMHSAEVVPLVPPQQFTAPSYYAPTELNKRLAEMGRDKPRREAALIGLWACAMPLLSLLCLISIGNGWGGSALGTGALLAFLLHYNSLIESLNQARAALSLSDFGKEWIGGYIEALFWPNSRIQGIAAEALTQRLPYLTAQDGALLTLQQREILYTRLHAIGVKPELRIAILKGLAAIGDERAVPHIERLATAVAMTPGRVRVRAVAREALSTLEARLATMGPGVVPSVVAPAAHAAPIATSAPVVEVISPQEQEFRSRQAEELLEKMKEESRNSRQPAMRLGFLIANWVVIFPFLSIHTILSLVDQNPWFISLLWAAFSAGSTQMYRLTLSPRLSETAQRLAKSEDIRAVGPLAEALDWPFEDIQNAARLGLERLLPQLRATDSKLLNEKQRQSLYKSLKMSNAHKEQKLILAILAALEQIGDKEAIPHVERLANAKARYEWERQIRSRAQQCLPYLQSRAQSNEHSTMLLRASSATEMSPEILLRPASPAHTEAAEELLRPSVDEA